MPEGIVLWSDISPFTVCRSSVGSNYARKRGLVCIVIGLIFLGAGVAVTVGFADFVYSLSLSLSPSLSLSLSLCVLRVLVGFMLLA